MIKVRSNIPEALASLQGEIKRLTTVAPERFVQAVIDGVSLHTVQYIPVDTSNLINSEAKEVTRVSGTVTGTLSYGDSQAPYALFVHEAPGTLLGTNTLRDPRNPGRGAHWDPDGRPGFLTLGSQEYIADQLPRDIERFGEL